VVKAAAQTRAAFSWGINSMFQIVGAWRDSAGVRLGFLAQPDNQN